MMSAMETTTCSMFERAYALPSLSSAFLSATHLGHPFGKSTTTRIAVPVVAIPTARTCRSSLSGLPFAGGRIRSSNRRCHQPGTRLNRTRTTVRFAGSGISARYRSCSPAGVLGAGVGGGGVDAGVDAGVAVADAAGFSDAEGGLNEGPTQGV
jgi:hypothetical protein